MATDLRAGSQVFAAKDRIQVYAQPFRDAERLLKTNLSKNSYREWKRGDLIGITTGQLAVMGQGDLNTFLEVTVQLGYWRKRLVDWVREDITGYLCVGEEPFNYYNDNPSNVIGIPNDSVPTATNNQYQTYFIIGAIFIIILALVFAARKGKI